jgi:thioesterase domain-containing protein
MELFALGRQIEGPIYAVQARGLDGSEEPNHSIADMAAYYLSAIQTVRPKGPYNLAGYSSGGLAAFEMAQQLKAKGEKVALLALIDTQTNARQWPVSIWFDVLRRRARHHRAAFRALSAKDKIVYGAKIMASLYRRILWRAGLAKIDQPAHPELHVPPALQKVFEATLDAVANYRPSQYNGDILLFVSQLGDPMMAEPGKIWPRYARMVETKNVPGDHRTMIDGENGKILAKILSERLQACASSI